MNNANSDETESLVSVNSKDNDLIQKDDGISSLEVSSIDSRNQNDQCDSAIEGDNTSCENSQKADYPTQATSDTALQQSIETANATDKTMGRTTAGETNMPKKNLTTVDSTHLDTHPRTNRPDDVLKGSGKALVQMPIDDITASKKIKQAEIVFWALQC